MVAAALFLALPTVREQTWRVMSDLLLAGFVFLAIRGLARYLNTGKLREALWLDSWTSLAILTKGTGWLLFVPIAAGPFIAGRKNVYATWSYSVAILLPCALSAPFFIWMNSLDLGYPLWINIYLRRLIRISSGWPAGEWMACVLVIFLVAGAIYRYLPREALRPDRTLGALLAFWCLTMVVFIKLLPITVELERYFLAFAAPGAYLIAGAMVSLERRLKPRQYRYAPSLAVLLCAAALASIPIPLQSTTAFSRAVAAIPARRERQIILVESDSAGEGAMIAARLAQDRDRSSHLLRASKFLSRSDWNGDGYSALYTTPAAMRSALAGAGLDYAVLDTSAPSRPDAELLKAVLQDPGWDVVARVPITLRSRRGELLVYHREPTGGPSAAPDSVRLGPERGSRTLTCDAW